MDFLKKYDFVEGIHLCIKQSFIRNNLFLTVLLLNYISNIYKIKLHDIILLYCTISIAEEMLVKKRKL